MLIIIQKIIRDIFYAKMADTTPAIFEEIDEEALRTRLHQITSLCRNDFSTFLDLRTKKVKRALEGWKEILLSVHSVLMWEKQWHPGALIGIITAIFLLIWGIDPSVLTTLSTIGLLVTIGDYMVPTIAPTIFRQDMWTGTKEKKFDEICRNIVFYYTQITTLCASYYIMRTVRPKIYFSTSIGFLLIMAWLGSSINNLLLTYLFLTVVVMIPGMEHQGIISKYGNCIARKLKDLSKQNKADPKTE